MIINKKVDTLYVLPEENYKSVQNTLKELNNHNKENTYTISLSGTIVTENKNNKILHCKPMDYNPGNQLYKIGLEHDVCIHVYTIEDVYTYNMNDDERDFETSHCNEKWTTAASEFHIAVGKLYLSPILDMHNREIISYSISRSPNFDQTKEMLFQAFEKYSDLKQCHLVKRKVIT